MTPSQSLRAAIDRADKWKIDWSDDEMIQDLEQIMDDLEASYTLFMNDIMHNYQYVSDIVANPKCVINR